MLAEWAATAVGYGSSIFFSKFLCFDRDVFEIDVGNYQGVGSYQEKRNWVLDLIHFI
jgi:hypothetical protein